MLELKRKRVFCSLPTALTVSVSALCLVRTPYNLERERLVPLLIGFTDKVLSLAKLAVGVSVGVCLAVANVVVAVVVVVVVIGTRAAPDGTLQ